MTETRTPDTRLESRDNPLLKLTRAVRDGRERNLILIEGVRLCEEAAHAGVHVEALLYTDHVLQDKGSSQLLSALRSKAARAHVVTASLLSSVSDTKTPQGLVVLAKRPLSEAVSLERRLITGVPLLLILHGVGNPSNAGSILRVAEGAGAGGVIATKGTVDLYSPKALRGAMGSTFRLPVWSGISFREAIDWCTHQGIRTIASDMRAASSYSEIDWSLPSALIVGAEADGLDDGEMAFAGSAVFIPMRSPVESLNVAVAAGIILYEAARQRSRAK